MHTPDYYIRHGADAGPAQPCEPLGLDPVSIRRANLDVDVLEMEQHRVRGQWAAALAHDTPVRLFRRDPESGELRQLFIGRVVSPMESHDPHAVRRTVRAHNVMQLYRECLWHRGRWTPHFLPLPSNPNPQYPLYHPDDDPARNHHECSPFYGQNFFRWPYSTPAHMVGRDVISSVRQSVTRAVSEWGYNAGRLQLRHLPPGSLPLDSMGYAFYAPIWLGDLGDAVWPDVQGYESQTFLDWLVRITQPLPDFCTWVDYHAPPFPILHLRRFKFAAVVDLPLGYPVMNSHVHRRRDEESSSIWIVNHGETAEPSPARLRTIRARYPTAPAGLNPLDRRAAIFDYGYALSSGPAANEAAAAIGEILTAPRQVGSLTLTGGAWQWCHPGSVLRIAGGDPLYVQETTHDLADETITASVGPPRHLGQFNADDIRAWLRKNFFPSEATG